MNHYLQLLFPQAHLEIDETLSPGPLTRIGPAGAESGAFEALSFGAREQMGVINRLAYADLLREAGRPGGREAGRPGGREAGRPGGREADVDHLG